MKSNRKKETTSEDDGSRSSLGEVEVEVEGEVRQDDREVVSLPPASSTILQNPGAIAPGYQGSVQYGQSAVMYVPFPSRRRSQSFRKQQSKLSKDIVLYIIKLAYQLKLREELLRREQPSRLRLVLAHRFDPDFMEVAVSLDRQFLIYADVMSPFYVNLRMVAIRPVLRSIESMPFEVLPADPRMHLGDKDRRWQLRLGHLQERLESIRRVGYHLLFRRPTAARAWLQQFHAMLPRVERSLYLAANSYEEYMDPETLPHRVEVLFSRISSLASALQPSLASPSLTWLEESVSPEDPENEA
mmetsp:Transcript_6086/g.12382  ORF Transcript_6086/g.12382 Transcript_6086/m.12382 type:complete len:300 (-) Transcript_6086:627-1526(-)|eukprot:CAMPEP_0171492220 /NCGR_PEP_ID=MMETSP0958-20121227/4290_1 /TAXON_ID=87120 /ORGANISM="Aurantiochytrium limacinum, Strain ATCCMYA-1381" /LENGTH=299 /DNA_ID=CAMNT_0012025717 /DNA_START=1703 /DNA_END=2602 /DNA_ORIENTATION=+